MLAPLVHGSESSRVDGAALQRTTVLAQLSIGVSCLALRKPASLPLLMPAAVCCCFALLLVAVGAVHRFRTAPADDG
jgi:hypothetical protein